MRKHTKVYLDFFGYGMDSWMPCEYMDMLREAHMRFMDKYSNSHL